MRAGPQRGTPELLFLFLDLLTPMTQCVIMIAIICCRQYNSKGGQMANEGLKLVVRGRIGAGIEWRNTFYGLTVSDYTNQSIEEWVTQQYSTIAAVTHSSVSIYAVDVAPRINLTDPLDPKGWGASDTVQVDWTGTNSASDALPPGDCYLVLAPTGVKHVIAKKYLPGVPENNQNGGVVGVDPGLALPLFCANWLAPDPLPVGEGWTPCAWGPTHGFVPLIGARWNNRVFHLRSRMFSHGV